MAVSALSLGSWRTLERVPAATGVAILRAEAAYHVGRQGRNVMLIPYATVDAVVGLAEVIVEYRRGWAESGAEGEATPGRPRVTNPRAGSRGTTGIPGRRRIRGPP